MIEIGKYNTLEVARDTPHGFFLVDKESEQDILLPYSSITEKPAVGAEIEVFAYNDSKDRPIATMKKPICTVGELAVLEVVAETRIGNFVSIGLERDVLVPFKEQAYKLKVSEKYLFYIYLDKTGRLTATTYVDKYLMYTDKYKDSDEVTGIVYGFQTNGSIMVAVDNIYKGVVLKKEYYRKVKEGEVLELYLKGYYEDSKMDLTLRKTDEDQRGKLEDIILDYIKDNGGSMPYCDKTSPEIIQEVFHESKNFFKKALGGLMKKGLIYQDDNGTYLKSSDS